MTSRDRTDRRPHRLRDVVATRRGQVLAWWGFTVTFAVLRLVTWLIREDVAVLGDVAVGGTHLHHYLWGILLLAVVGGLALGDRSPRARAALGLFFGIGLALVVDEAALLIQLEDVYWDTFGWVSVGLALLVIGVAGSILALTEAPREPGR
ncbi:hypothetical protein GCM10023328_09300 [Modestobacter marinus]|uniref:Integral membrane protein n=1 Tax=Modestobacter marinus TaxID=477641 RepID=A0A846LHC2_9ACTN|nr:hypothetical protein [Modestobacter marinus]NIH66651.1 hypothetical protein [Modestobacter marinus]GGL48016.1 hypothetical protein GCM10011589_00660 [Modestobacter marinus]